MSPAEVPFKKSRIFETFTGHRSKTKRRSLQESVAFDAMSGDANALKIGQTLADKFRQAGDKKDGRYSLVCLVCLGLWDGLRGFQGGS